jgi:hypothetical protein
MNGSKTDCKLKTLVVGNLQIRESSTVFGLARLPAIGILLPARKSLCRQNGKYCSPANTSMTKPGKD